MAGEYVMRIGKGELIDERKALGCDLVVFAGQQLRRGREVPELARRALFLFEHKFIKRDYLRMKRRLFR